MNNEFVTKEQLKILFADDEIEAITTPYDNTLEQAVDNFILAIIETLHIDIIMDWLEAIVGKVRGER